METKNKVYKKKKNTNRIKWGRMVIFVCGIAYIIMFVYTFFSQSVEKVNVTYGTVEELERVTGYITRNEKIVSSNIDGNIYPVVLEGERVSKNQSVAVIRNENSDYIEGKIAALKNKLSTLSNPSIFNNDILVLDNEINLALNSLMLSNYNEKFSDLVFIKNKIEDKLNKKAVIIGETSPKGSIENEYYKEISEYENELLKVREELISPIAGTVAYKLDGYEEVFAYSAIGDYDAKTLSNMNVPSGELVGTVKENSFKIVDNIEGYITVIATSDKALNAQVDKKVQLRIPEISNIEITGKIEYVTIEDNQAIITFRINRGIEDLINYRKVKVELIWDSEDGMVVPSTSILKDENGENSIFIINGNRVIKEKVNVELDNGDEAIVSSENAYSLALYDSIAKDAKSVSTDKIIISE